MAARCCAAIGLDHGFWMIRYKNKKWIQLSIYYLDLPFSQLYVFAGNMVFCESYFFCEFLGLYGSQSFWYFKDLAIPLS